MKKYIKDKILSFLEINLKFDELLNSHILSNGVLNERVSDLTQQVNQLKDAYKEIVSIGKCRICEKRIIEGDQYFHLRGKETNELIHPEAVFCSENCIRKITDLDGDPMNLFIGKAQVVGNNTK